MQHRRDNFHQIDVTQYTLARLSNVGAECVKEVFPERMKAVPNIVELSDESWEVLILKKAGIRLQDIFKTILPESELDVKYNTFEATAEDLQEWGGGRAQFLLEHSFRQRADHVIKEGGPEEAAYYSHLLAFMDSKRAAASTANPTMVTEGVQENDMTAPPEHSVAFEDEGMGAGYVAGLRHPVKCLTNRDRSGASSTCSLNSDDLDLHTERMGGGQGFRAQALLRRWITPR